MTACVHHWLLADRPIVRDGAHWTPGVCKKCGERRDHPTVYGIGQTPWGAKHLKKVRKA